MEIRPAQSFRGTFRLQGDKSITHRAFLFGALAQGISTIEGASGGDDCASTRRCLTDMGVRFDDSSERTSIAVHGGLALAAPTRPLDCGNSGTTLRLLMGILAAEPFASELLGDESLNRRPMERVASPLRHMGARIETTGGRPPVRIQGTKLRGASVTPEAASAQIKSAVLLAGLQAEGLTTLHEPLPTRDHTERMIRWFGGDLRQEGAVLRIEGPQTLKARDIRIPGDPSSAAPLIVAALILPDSEIVIEDVLLNPHRVRYLDILRAMGGRIEIETTSSQTAEPAGRVIARSSELRGVSIAPEEVPAVVDELPILAVAGAFARGRLQVRGASELRVKESDRIRAMVEGLGAMGVHIAELEDGFTVDGGESLRGATVASHGDHRIAMALTIAALGARGATLIQGAEVVSISWPSFFAEIARGAAG